MHTYRDQQVTTQLQALRISSDASDETMKPQMLTIPGEIRNEIYRCLLLGSRTRYEVEPDDPTKVPSQQDCP